MFTYNNGVRLSFEDYSIAIPDGFSYEEGCEGRKFVAWLPNESDPDDYFEANIQLFDGQIMEQEDMGELATPDFCAATMKFVYSMLKQQMPALGGEEYFLPVNKSLPAGGCSANYDDGAYHYNFYLYTKNGFKMMRIMMCGKTKAQKEECDRDAIEWINTMELVDKFDEPKKLTDESFISEKLSEKKADEWADLFNTLFSIVIKIKDNLIRAEVNIVQNDANHGIMPDMKAFNGKIKGFLDDAANSASELFDDACTMFEKFAGNNTEKAVLKNIYEQIEDYFEYDKFTATSQEGQIVAPIPKQAELLAKIKKYI